VSHDAGAAGLLLVMGPEQGMDLAAPAIYRTEAGRGLSPDHGKAALGMVDTDRLICCVVLKSVLCAAAAMP
jgi:hypothetical protein